MSAYPTNTNFLSPVGFKFQIKKTPTTNFFVQAVSIPQLTLGTTEVRTPFVNIPVPGDRITYGEFQVTFKVDEDLTNYLELYSWITQLGFPESFEQYKEIASKPNYTGDGIYSEASLMILNSAKHPTVEVHFYDMYPLSLSDVLMDSRNPDIDYVECTVSFAYRYFDIKRVSG